MLKELTGKDLQPIEDLSAIPFETTEEISSFEMNIGQGRAVNAIDFFMNVKADGYNLFCSGPEGIGKQSLVLRLLRKQASKQKTPADWCYVNNFQLSHKPKALKLPAGKAVIFAKETLKAVKELTSVLKSAFEDSSYKEAVKKVEEQYQTEKNDYFSSLQSLANGKKVSILKMPTGLVVAPFNNGEVLSSEAFDKLPEEEQDLILQDLNETQDKLEEALAVVPKWDKERQEALETLRENQANIALDKIFIPLKNKFLRIKSVQNYFKEMRQDILDHLDSFSAGNKKESEEQEDLETLLIQRYQVNVFVDHSKQKGTPIKVLMNPTISQLLGRMERMQRMGVLMTDFSLLKAGALHEANGGYLIIDAKSLTSQPLAWESLKRCLKSKTIAIESATDDNALMMTSTLEPEPIPLDIKVVLTGSPYVYYALSEKDSDFDELFKVEASFKSSFRKTPEYIKQYANLLGALGKDKGLRPLTKQAVNTLVTYSSRIAGHQEKLTAYFSYLIDLIQEANYVAQRKNMKIIDASEITEAIKGKILRSDLVKESFLEQIKEGSLMIDTQGEKVGQINGLAVHEYGNCVFGCPSRITAQVSIGKGEVLDIEREVELGGAIHSKGVLILSSLLASRFAQKNPLSLDARIVFEQSYGEIDGDSASCAEFFTLSSAISKQPIKQSWAITGSLNQFGEVQPIGGVNEKIEGFFDVCSLNGLTGEQGVIIPETNRKNLILKPEIVKAVNEGKFHIVTISHVDDGYLPLFGIPAGEADENGNWPADSMNGKMAAALQKYFDRSQMINGQRTKFLR